MLFPISAYCYDLPASPGEKPMRLYLSSFRLGHHPAELLRLLAGGTRIAVILNAGDFLEPDRRTLAKEADFALLTDLGMAPEELDLRHYFGDAEGLRTALANFDTVWVRGGNSFILRRAFRASGADVVIPEFLAQDGLVYAGYSAGVCILGPSLRGIELVDDPAVVPEGYPGAVVLEGLGVLPYSVAPHYRPEHPESPAIDQVVSYFVENQMPFVALRDGEVIVREGDAEVIWRLDEAVSGMAD